MFINKKKPFISKWERALGSHSIPKMKKHLIKFTVCGVQLASSLIVCKNKYRPCGSYSPHVVQPRYTTFLRKSEETALFQTLQKSSNFD